jgi:hypothetical protein
MIAVAATFTTTGPQAAPTRLDGGHRPELKPLLLLDYHKQNQRMTAVDPFGPV